jgi:CDP-glucose 4,6-dehydratase
MNLENIFNNKKVLVTGHTGFKGTWLSLWLKQLGADVTGISIDIPSNLSHFKSLNLSEKMDDLRFDIRDIEVLKSTFKDLQPDFVFHLAAQALVRPSYENPLETFTTNAIGSVNVLEALRVLDKPVVAVMITSDKAYNNVEWPWGYRETDRLGGKDPYSASKGMAELAIQSYVDSFYNESNSNVRLGVARAGNVIGGGDWASDRIVPDCMKAWSRNETVDIRSPDSTRPWQHVLEPLSGYLNLGADLYQNGSSHGEAYNFGPTSEQSHSVRELIDEMANYWANVRWNDISKSQNHLYEAGLLKLNCDKASFFLNWRPTLQFGETVRMTVDWYKQFYDNNNKNMYDFSMGQIYEYSELAKIRGINWAISD